MYKYTQTNNKHKYTQKLCEFKYTQKSKMSVNRLKKIQISVKIY